MYFEGPGHCTVPEENQPGLSDRTDYHLLFFKPLATPLTPDRLKKGLWRSSWIGFRKPQMKGT